MYPSQRQAALRARAILIARRAAALGDLSRLAGRQLDAARGATARDPEHLVPRRCPGGPRVLDELDAPAVVLRRPEPLRRTKQ